MKTALVTGANGFIGHRLIKELSINGIKIIAVVRNIEKADIIKNIENVDIIEAEFEDYLDLDKKIKCKIDVFYHLAWDGVFGEPFKDYKLQLNNVKYACDAICGAIKLNCSKFVLVGTVNELEVKKYIDMDECSPRYTCIYGMSKLTAEMICKTIAYNKGIEFNSVMLAMVYGEGDKSNMLPKVLIRSFLKKERPKLVEGNYLYDWIYIDDVAKGLIAVGDRGKNLRSYYLGHSDLTTFKEIIKKVRDILCPELDLIFGEYPDSSLIDYSRIEIKKLEKDTGFIPLSDFKESILKTAEWIKQNDF